MKHLGAYLRAPPSHLAWFALDRGLRRLPAGRLRSALVRAPLRWEEDLLQRWGRAEGAARLGPGEDALSALRSGLVRIGGLDAPLRPSGPWGATGGPPLLREAAGYLDGLCGAATHDPALLEALARGLPRRLRSGAPLHPYPTATRLLNTLRSAALLAARGPSGALDALRALAAGDLLWLSLWWERYSPGNHRIRELVALRLGWAVFGRPGWYATPLEAALDDQLLPDGGHVERCPSYHLRVLRDLVELRLALGADAVPLPLLHRAFAWALSVALPDGLPLLGDGVASCTPDLRTLLEVAALPTPPSAPEGRISLPDSGIEGVRDGDEVLLLRGGPTPTLARGHVHGDQGAITWSHGGRRVLDGLGVSTYSDGPDRDRDRQASSHSTVERDGEPQLRCFGAFRSTDSAQGSILGPGSVRVTWPSGAVLDRLVERVQDGLVVTDRLDGAGTAWFHVPDARIQDGLIRQEGRTVRVEGAALAPSVWHPDLGAPRPAVSARVRIEGARTTRITLLAR